MQFANSILLSGLWAAVGLPFVLFWLARRRKQIMQRFAQNHLLNDLAENWDERKVFLKSVLLTLTVAFSVLALARPQWGFEWQEVKRQGLDILLLVDTSKSMLTEDVKPNRLARTKLAVQDLIKKLKGDRIGLVAFAGDAFLVCPLTVDYSGFLLSLEDLDTSTIPRGGTNLAAAMQEAVKEYDTTPSKYKVAIIVTDGDNLEGDPLAAAKKAKEKGIKIYTVGIGTPEGELIRYQNTIGEYEFMKDEQGNFVKSRLNEKLLQDIALLTGGLYVRAGGAQFGLDLIYENELSKLERRQIESKKEKRYHERFQIPLGAAVILLIIETCLPTRRRIKTV